MDTGTTRLGTTRPGLLDALSLCNDGGAEKTNNLDSRVWGSTYKPQRIGSQVFLGTNAIAGAAEIICGHS